VEIPDSGALETEVDVYDEGAEDDAIPEPAHANLHPDDPKNFFKLSKFLKIAMAMSVTDQDIDEAETLIRAYTTELLHVRRALCEQSTADLTRTLALRPWRDAT
jgi:hypothetical protein